jgi:hypothetical protein
MLRATGIVALLFQGMEQPNPKDVLGGIRAFPREKCGALVDIMNLISKVFGDSMAKSRVQSRLID